MTDKRPDHHAAWLAAHPHRDAEWFDLMTADGFDVHHIDGDHSNNDPSNLALIEHTDHMGLHNGGRRTLGRLAWKPKKAARKEKKEPYSPLRGNKPNPTTSEYLGDMWRKIDAMKAADREAERLVAEVRPVTELYQAVRDVTTGDVELVRIAEAIPDSDLDPVSAPSVEGGDALSHEELATKWSLHGDKPR